MSLEEAANPASTFTAPRSKPAARVHSARAFSQKMHAATYLCLDLEQALRNLKVSHGSASVELLPKRRPLTLSCRKVRRLDPHAQAVAAVARYRPVPAVMVEPRVPQERLGWLPTSTPSPSIRVAVTVRPGTKRPSTRSRTETSGRRFSCSGFCNSSPPARITYMPSASFDRIADEVVTCRLLAAVVTLLLGHVPKRPGKSIALLAGKLQLLVGRLVPRSHRRLAVRRHGLVPLIAA